MTERVTIHGRVIELEPLEEDEEVQDVVVVVKTKQNHRPRSYVAAGADDRGASPAMNSEIRYLMELGMDADQIANRTGNRRLPWAGLR